MDFLQSYLSVEKYTMQNNVYIVNSIVSMMSFHSFVIALVPLKYNTKAYVRIIPLKYLLRFNISRQSLTISGVK